MNIICPKCGHEIKSEKSPEDIDKAAIGYQAAVDLWGTIVASQWSRFNAMMVANSIVVALLGTILTKGVSRGLIVGLSLIGIIFDVFWYLMMHRDTKYVDHYRNSARSLEEEWLDPPVKTVRTQNDDVKTGGEIVWGCSSKISIRRLVDWTICVFFLIYIAFIVYIVN